MQKTLKWTAAQPLKRPDTIISSKARETGNIGFKPSYLAEPKDNMKFIMSNEYMRIWFKERGKFEKHTYSRVQIIKEESKIKRRFVQRMMTYKKPNKNDFLEHKIAVNGPSDVKDYAKFKYKPACTRQKEKGEAKGGESDSNMSKHVLEEHINESGQLHCIPCCPPC